MIEDLGLGRADHGLAKVAYAALDGGRGGMVDACVELRELVSERNGFRSFISNWVELIE